MKHLTIEEFVNSYTEEQLWKLIEDYENWTKYGEVKNSFLRNETKKNFVHYYGLYRDISHYIYQHFALKYKQVVK